MFGCLYSFLLLFFLQFVDPDEIPKRGKEREFPKIKKPSPLKKVGYDRVWVCVIVCENQILKFEILKFEIDCVMFM